MEVTRILRHLATPRWRVRRAFPETTLDAIEQTIRAGEARHGGELCFVVEGALDALSLLRGQSARERALELFSHLRIWDTERNDGVLIYVLWADRRVEVIADRRIHAQAGPGAWEAVCRRMEAAFAVGAFQAGAIEGIRMVAAHLERHHPVAAHRLDELPDRPIVL